MVTPRPPRCALDVTVFLPASFVGDSSAAGAGEIRHQSPGRGDTASPARRGGRHHRNAAQLPCVVTNASNLVDLFVTNAGTSADLDSSTHVGQDNFSAAPILKRYQDV